MRAFVRIAAATILAALVTPGVTAPSSNAPDPAKSVTPLLPPANRLRAFPGAEGFGAYTPGGRGGKVYIVSTVEDYDSKQPPFKGSFREAVQAKEARIIVFAVSGTIHLKKRLRIDQPYLTIAGQTAPGDGICIADRGTSVATHDVVIRHLRFRHGDASGDGSDSLSFRNAENVMVDHCSMSWGMDESFSFTKSTKKVTAQWCIISEGLNAEHHGYGSLIAPDADCQMSFHHNLYADDYGRCPRVGSRGQIQFLFDYRNNVNFNWGTGYDWGAWAVYGKAEDENVDMNFIGNYSIAGLDTSVEATLAKGFTPRFELTTEGFQRAALSSHAKTSRIFQSGNKIDGNVNGRLDGIDTGWDMVNGVYTKMDKEFPIPAEFAVTTEAVERAYEHVLANAGAMPWRRDGVDARVVAGVRQQTGRVINSQKEVGGWPELQSIPAPVDSDGDGIPDEWEQSHGLNAHDPADASQPAKDGSGYSNIEVYMNSLIPSPSNDGIQITQLSNRLRIEINGQLFTEYFFKDAPRPYYYPLLGPGNLPMTRNWPMKDPPGEEHDHPHHRSLWFAHGDVNGVDFWTERKGSGTIVHDGFTTVRSGKDLGLIVSRDKWLAADGTVVCWDKRTFRIYNPSSPDERVFDFEITLHSAKGQLEFGDTKEGTMAVRLAETMRLKGPVGHGHIVNGAGVRDGETWGKRAEWCDYYGPVDGKTVGIAIFDHPENPHHPTWWMVRDYGLFAANPFGQHDFEALPDKAAGKLVVPAGKSVTFRYRFYLHGGDQAEAKVAERYQDYIRSK
jgi:pectate lyase